MCRNRSSLEILRSGGGAVSLSCLALCAVLRSERHANPPQPGKLEGGPAQIEAEDAAEKIQLDAFDPADREAEIASERREHASAGRREAEPGAAVGIILADRRGRQHGLQLGNRVE